MSNLSHLKSGEPQALDVRGITRDGARLRRKGKGWRRPFLVGVMERTGFDYLPNFHKKRPARPPLKRKL